MIRPVAVLRPPPGDAATAARAASLGLTVIRIPLFAVRPVAWVPPLPADFDGLLITSANAVRHGGEALGKLTGLPVLAVGQATARAAQAAGFTVSMVGTGDAAALLAEAGTAGFRRLLHLAGRERSVEAGGIVARVETVYASEAIDLAPPDVLPVIGSVALIHSARAARRLSQLIAEPGDRAATLIAAISPAVAAAAGAGWAALATANDPHDDALLVVAQALARR